MTRAASIDVVRSKSLAQNFLQNRRTARRLAHLANDSADLLCVDLGAGKGMVTEACLDVRSGPVLAIEFDRRLADALSERFADEPRVTVVEGDLRLVEPPSQPFVIAANPPFNTSTAIARRWLLHERLRSAALLVEKPFGRKLAGEFGATKLSLSFAPFVEFDLPFDVRSAEFHPRPSVPTALLTVRRRSDPLVDWLDRRAYWLIVNLVFERGQHTVGEAIAPLGLRGVPKSLRSALVRESTPAGAVELFGITASSHASRAIEQFDAALPAIRRTSIADVVPSLPSSAGNASDHISRPRRQRRPR